MDDAACRNMQLDIFFPAWSLDSCAQPAKDICAACPVITQCLNYAIDNNIAWGIWGGMTPAERIPDLREREKLRGRLPPKPYQHGRQGGARWHQRRGEIPCPACVAADSEARKYRKALQR